jgi:hypothetical protein
MSGLASDRQNLSPDIDGPDDEEENEGSEAIQFTSDTPKVKEFEANSLII